MTFAAGPVGVDPVRASGVFPAGRHELDLDDASLPAGVFVVRVTAGGAVLTRRLSLVR